MRIWITGINGFLGSHLADAMIALGHDVAGNDNDICSSTKHSNGGFADCCDFNVMKDLFNSFKPDVVYHCAATAHEGLSNFSPSFITRNIYEASVSTFSAAIASGVRRIIFMSSMARYGKQELPFRESMTPMPVDPYGIAKVAAEETLKVLCKTHSVEYVIVVPHNIVGLRQKYDDPYRNVASIMINRALQNKSLIVYGDGEQKRCFSPIADCLDSLVKMLTAPIAGETINIGPETGTITVLKLATTIRDMINPMLNIDYHPDRPNEVKKAYCSNQKARRLLSYEPKQSIYACLNDMVSYIRANGVKEFQYGFPIEIENGCPETWSKKLI